MTEIHYRYRFLPERRFEFISDSAVDVVGYTQEEHYEDPDLGLKRRTGASVQRQLRLHVRHRFKALPSI